MKRIIQLAIVWTVAVGALSCGTLTSGSVFGALQEDEQTFDEERLGFVIEQCVNSIRDSVRTSLDLKIDFIQRFLAIEESDLRKIRVYSKGLSAKHARLFRKPIEERLQRFATQLEGSTFTVNGQTYTFEGEEESAVPDFNIKLNLSNQHSRGSLTISFSNRSSGFGINAEGNKKLSFEASDNFRKALNSIDDRKLRSARESIEASRKQNVTHAMAIMLGDKMSLREDQMPLMKKWVAEHVGSVSEIAIYQQLRDQFRNSQVFKEDPDFLTDIQLDAWRILKNSQYPFGW